MLVDRFQKEFVREGFLDERVWIRGKAEKMVEVLA